MARGFFIITDISGYTEFLTQTELEHAHAILQELFKVQLDQIKAPFVVSSFRGDAIVMYIPETGFIQPQSVVEALENIYVAFVLALEQMAYNTTCPCRACRKISGLNLKMVVHYGDYLIQRMGSQDELVGADVIVPHRMLKNRVIEKTGIQSYILFSEAAMTALHLPEIVDSLHDHAETYEHYGEIRMVVHGLSAAWERQKTRRRKMVDPETAWVKFEVEIEAPPMMVWEYVTTPVKKRLFMGFEISQRSDDLGGRVREGAAFHCAHGDLMFDYQIVDWQPFDYFTDVGTDTLSHLEYYETCHFIPTESGTRFISAVELVTEEPVSEEVRAALQGAWEMGYGGLKGLIEKDLAAGEVTVAEQA